MQLFGDITEVQYLKQLEVNLEKQFFHWVTARAVNSLIDEGTLQFSFEQLLGETGVKFIRHPRNRYPRRKIARSLAVVRPTA